MKMSLLAIQQKRHSVRTKRNFQKIGRIKFRLATGISDKIHHQKVRLSHS